MKLARLLRDAAIGGSESHAHLVYVVVHGGLLPANEIAGGLF